MLSRRLINIYVADFVHTREFPYSVSETYRCTHIDSIFRWITVAFQCNSILMPNKIGPSSARLICLSTCSDRSQMASSTRDSPHYTTRPVVVKELASTQTVTSRPSTQPSLCDKSFCVNLLIMSVNIRLWGGSCTCSSQPVVSEFVRRFMNEVATRSQLHTGRRCSDEWAY